MIRTFVPFDLQLCQNITFRCFAFERVVLEFQRIAFQFQNSLVNEYGVRFLIFDPSLISHEDVFRCYFEFYNRDVWYCWFFLFLVDLLYL